MLSVGIPGAAVWAADDVSSDDTSLSSTAGAREVTRGYIPNELVGFKPQVGAMAFTDAAGTATARAIEGLTIDVNLASMINRSWSNFFIAPSTGVLFSHLGDPSSNFIGTNPNSSIGSAGSNLLMIPANLKIGYNITDYFRVAAHGGGNVLYRSVASSMFLGDSSASPDPVWRIFPNVGGDVELGLGRSMAILLRPDVTLTPGNTVFTGTVGVSFGLS